MTLTTTKRLNNGVEMPYFGLGVFKSPPGEETSNAVCWALQAGYRHIDTAAIYRNEESVGQGMRQSGVAREEIFLTTKLWNENMRQGTQREAFEESLKKLGTDYVDLYLIHWPVKEKYVESYRVMEQLYKEGRIRAIGVSNFQIHHLKDLMGRTEIVPAVNQVECHPQLTQRELHDFCIEQGIALEAWSPLGAGNLTQDATLSAIGAKYGKTAAQVMLRWDLQRDIITIPKSVKSSRIIENSQVFDFALSDDDMAAIFAMDTGHRFGADPDTFTF